MIQDGAGASSAPADAASAAARPTQSSALAPPPPRINALLLTISPPALEHAYWASDGVVRSHRNIDRFAFVMSSLNLLTGWQAAAQLRSAPRASLLLQLLCAVFFLLSVCQQAVLQRAPGWYAARRNAIIGLTRLVRGAWMVCMCVMTTEADIHVYFVSRKLAAGASALCILLQLLMLLTLILFGQALYWTLPFKLALPLQAAYVGSCLLCSSSVQCVMRGADVLGATLQLLASVRLAVEWLVAVLAEVSLLPSSDDSSNSDGTCSSSSDGGGGTAARLLLTWWLIAFGLLLPLYVLYVTELQGKRAFIKRHQQRQQQQQQLQLASSLSAALQLSVLLHVAAVVIQMTLALAAAEGLVGAFGPPACPHHAAGEGGGGGGAAD